MKIHAMATSFLLAGLVACGGGDNETATAATDKAPPTRVATTLVDDDGAPMPATAAAPADAGARIRSGRYASAEQATALEATLGDRAIRIDVECCGAPAADLAVMMAFVQQAAHDLPNAAPVLVHGADLRIAAAVADRLDNAGLSRVWLVVE